MLLVPKDLHFESFAIDHLVDEKGRFLLTLDPSFPLSINSYCFRPEHGRLRLNWHERLEIFIAVQGAGEFHMGSETVSFSPGDILVVENMKLHGLGALKGKQCRAISISFLPELIYNPGAPISNFALLVPFYLHRDGCLKVSGTDKAARSMHFAITKMLESYESKERDRPGCQVFLLELLYWLSRHFKTSENDYTEYMSHQHRIRRLAKVLEYIRTNYGEHIGVEDAAEIAAMSSSRFMRFFKKSTGMTFVAYLTHVRINVAAEMLRSPDQSISDVAVATGFSDQSYFGRVFKQQFGVSPMRFRSQNRCNDSTSWQNNPNF